MLQSWPDPAFFPVDDAAEAELGWIQGFILGVRQIRGEMDIAPGKRIPVLLQDTTADDVRLDHLAVRGAALRFGSRPRGKRIPVLLQDTTADDVRLLAVHDRYLRELARLASIDTLPPGSQAPPSATALVGSLKLLVPIAGLIDVAAERARLTKNRLKASADLERVEQKLATETFTSHAPEAVVAKERERHEALRRDLAKLDAQLTQLAAL